MAALTGALAAVFPLSGCAGIRELVMDGTWILHHGAHGEKDRSGKHGASGAPEMTPNSAFEGCSALKKAALFVRGEGVRRDATTDERRDRTRDLFE